jgi:micrococcal nuclease
MQEKWQCFANNKLIQFFPTQEKVRLIGINTPESIIRHGPYGEEAAAFTKSRLTGKTVYLERDVSERDKYGRLLRYVWLEPPSDLSEQEIRGKMFNAILVLEGYAQVATYPPDVKYVQFFVKFQQEARKQGKGLWGLVPATPGKETKYIGNARSKIFHRPDCEWARKIAPHNKVEFKTREEAVDAGLQAVQCVQSVKVFRR